MLLKSFLLLAGVAAAVPAQLEERTVDCKAVDVVVKVLKLAPKASSYCSSVLKISAVTTTATVSVATTTLGTTTTTATVTSTGGAGGAVTITADPSTTTTTSTSTSTITTYSRTCPAANKRDVKNRSTSTKTTAATTTPTASGKCDGSPILGYACNLVSSACSCLNLPMPTSTLKKTMTGTVTKISTATTTSTVFVPTTTTKTPITTATSTTTICAPYATCSPISSCGNVNTCNPSGGSGCFCVNTLHGGLCLDLSTNNGCGGSTCSADTDCTSGQFCVITTCCDTGVCAGGGTCVNPGSMRRLRRDGGVLLEGARGTSLDPEAVVGANSG